MDMSHNRAVYRTRIQGELNMAKRVLIFGKDT